MHATDLTIQDLMANPKKFGVPSFEEFSKNPEKFRNPADWLFAAADAGTLLGGLAARIGRYTYECQGYPARTLHECERIALREGVSIMGLEMRPELKDDLTAGKLTCHVRFMRKRMGDAENSAPSPEG